MRIELVFMPAYILVNWDFPEGVSRKNGDIERTEENVRLILSDVRESIDKFCGIGGLSLKGLIDIVGRTKNLKVYDTKVNYQVDFSELSRFLVRYTEASEGSCSCCTNLRGEQVGDRMDDCAEYCEVHETFDDIDCVYTDKKTGKRTRAYSRDESPIVAKFRSIACPDCKPRAGKTLAQIVGEMDKEK